VTKRQWEAVMGTRPWVGQPEVLDDPDSPAVYVSWDDAQAFIGAVNLLGQGTFRLPTEAEREYACRAGTTTRFHWGDDPACAQVGDYEWYLGNAGNVGQSYAHVVGLKLPNPWGLYDMNGNVEEWCQDWFSQEYPSEAVTDPVGPPSGVLRVLRCAGWFSDPRWCRSDDRGHNDPSFRHPGQGFRVARQ
jgi:sulfatase modifying factor 1